MSLIGRSLPIQSPIQEHPVYLVNELQWITGHLKSMGNPHMYINQDDLAFFTIQNSHTSPWSFTGIPGSHSTQTMVKRDNLHLVAFPEPSSADGFRPPMQSATLILSLSMAIIRAKAPIMGEASVDNFLDYYKGRFVAFTNAKIHFLTDCAIKLPAELDILYINREKILSYVGG